MDINSGDSRYQEYRGDRLVKNEIHESALSKEARRLGLRLPAERRWEPMARSHPGGPYEDYVYGFLMGVCNELVMILTVANAPDGERRVVLEKFLTMLRTDDPNRVWHEGRFLVLDVGDKYDVHIYTPQFEEELRRMRTKKQSQKPVP